MRQRTIAKSVEVVGIGLHKGTPVKMRLEPLDENLGVIFYREDLDISIELSIDNVVDTKMATVIGKNGAIISTVEHLLSAIYSYGIDNVRVVLNSDEMPILDGSSLGFCMLLDEAGYRELEAPKRAIKIKRNIEVRDGDKFVSLSKSDDFLLNFQINFNHSLIKNQNFNFKFSKNSYIDSISRARTFGFLKDVEYLRSIGLAKGGSLENAIVLDESGVLNPEGLRFEDEFVRHKILDAIGDLAFLGYSILGEYSSFAGSHSLNAKLCKQTLSDERNFEIIEAKDEVFEFERVYAKS